MKKICVVYHSGYGHTEHAAKSVGEGAKTLDKTEVFMIPVGEVDSKWDILNQADAIIFGSPTYMGSASAPFKEFMEKSSKPWMAQAWKNKLASGFTVSANQNGDKLQTLEQFFVFASQHSMIWVSLGLLPGNNSSKGSISDLNRLGSSSGAMAQANSDQGKEGMQESDLKTMFHLGQRVAQVAQNFTRPA